MIGDRTEESTGETETFHRVQPERNLEANWEVDLARKLEDYLLKICSGEITGSQEDAVNFAEAALLLQGSVQVYSRKVEYLYNLVLHALEFLSQKRQEDQPEGTSVNHEESASHAVSDEENDLFWVLDDITVEKNNCIDSSNNKNTLLNQFVRPPANLVVLEGDCLDTTGDGSELESYLLATSDLYQDFILLDPCDAVAVDDCLNHDEVGREKCGTCKGNSRASSTRKIFLSMHGKSHDASIKSHNASFNRSPRVNDCTIGVDTPACDGFDMGDRNSEPDSDDSDDNNEDDPWKPLNPHETGNLKVKPFRKVNSFGRNGSDSQKKIPTTTLFPLAGLNGPISSELIEIWKRQENKFHRQRGSQFPSSYEKLRQSLTSEGNGASDAFADTEDNNDDDNGYDGGIPDFGGPDFNMPETNEDMHFNHEKHDNNAAQFGNDEVFDHENPNSQASLEDLCQSHLDSLLASIAETEKQTELAARVATWKQKIEQNLEEQDSRPPFDIHDYGEKIIDKLSRQVDQGNVTSFADVVKGQEKHEIARTFSALLQLVNNGDVDLDRKGVPGESTCYTASNPFHVRLLKHDRRRVRTQFRNSGKRGRSAVANKPAEEKSSAVNSALRYKSTMKSSRLNCRNAVKLGKLGGGSCSPQPKRTRGSQYVEADDLHLS